MSAHHTKWKGAHEGNQVVSEMSAHYSILNWYCHGGVNHFATRGSTSPLVLTTDDGRFWNLLNNLFTSPVTGDGLDNMTNTNYPSVIYSICCETCAFDDFRSTDNPATIPDGNKYPTDQRSMVEGYNCMSWKVNGPLKLGYTRNGYVGSSYRLHQEFADLWSSGFIDPGSGQSSYHAGVAEAVSKQNYNSHYLRYSHNCFGCPETEIWTDSLDVFDNVAISDNGNSIYVNANEPNCNICACSADDGKYFW